MSDDGGAYPYIDLVDEAEWSHDALEAIDACVNMFVYGRSQMDDDPESGVAYCKGARRAGMLATLWWLTGWVQLIEEVE